MFLYCLKTVIYHGLTTSISLQIHQYINTQILPEGNFNEKENSYQQVNPTSVYIRSEFAGKGYIILYTKTFVFVFKMSNLE